MANQKIANPFPVVSPLNVCYQCLTKVTLVSEEPAIMINACPMWGIAEKLLVKEDAGQYDNINQGCLGVDGMDDKEEMRLADVCRIKCDKSVASREPCPQKKTDFL